MKKIFFVLPVIFALAVFAVFAGGLSCPPYYDFLQLGDSASELAHSTSGFGPVEPTTHPGGWGNIGTESSPSDHLAKVVWEGSEPDTFVGRGAEFTMKVPTNCSICRVKANWLNLRVLDGAANDDFLVLWKNQNGNWEVIDIYVSDPSTTEYWKNEKVSLASIPERLRKAGKGLTFKVVVTGNAWTYKSTYGQLALDWVSLE